MQIHRGPHADSEVHDRLELPQQYDGPYHSGVQVEHGVAGYRALPLKVQRAVVLLMPRARLDVHPERDEVVAAARYHLIHHEDQHHHRDQHRPLARLKVSEEHAARYATLRHRFLRLGRRDVLVVPHLARNLTLKDGLPFLGLLLGLHVRRLHQLHEVEAQRLQLIERTLLLDTTVVHHDNLVGELQVLQLMRHQNPRFPLDRQLNSDLFLLLSGAS